MSQPSGIPTDVNRDQNWVLREYDQTKLPLVLERIEAVASQGETELSRILSQVEDIGRGHPTDEFKDLVIKGDLRDSPASFMFGGVQKWISSLLRDLVRDDATTLAELGSGYGRNLLWFWCHGGRADLDMHAMEFTANGRACTERLFSFAKGANVSVDAFNYYEPDFSSLADDDAPLAVFSCHSIEQIPTVPDDVITRLVALPRPVRCIHMEPVGWQMPGAENRTGTSQAHADKHDYNRNLWQLLKRFEASGDIKIIRHEPEILGLNTSNGTSLIEWHKA